MQSSDSIIELLRIPPQKSQPHEIFLESYCSNGEWIYGVNLIVETNPP